MKANMEQVRSFIAIELPAEVKAGLKQVQDRLKSSDPSCAKWVDPQSIHLTLKFLGNVDIDRLDSITRAIQDASVSISPFELNIDDLGCFPNSRRVQTIWIGLTGDITQLQTLQNNVESRVSPLGFPTEKRLFTPHLTLARVRDYITPEQRQSLGALVTATQIKLNLNFKIISISLMRSHLTPAGAIYTRLRSVELKPPC
jgi:RNA 2',3'-cyclic 3'-phosphodiesterase